MNQVSDSFLDHKESPKQPLTWTAVTAIEGSLASLVGVQIQLSKQSAGEPGNYMPALISYFAFFLMRSQPGSNRLLRGPLLRPRGERCPGDQVRGVPEPRPSA